MNYLKFYFCQGVGLADCHILHITKCPMVWNLQWGISWIKSILFHVVNNDLFVLISTTAKHARVILSDQVGEPHSDYINASYIDVRHNSNTLKLKSSYYAKKTTNHMA